MTRPTLEVADIIRVSGNSFWERHGSHYAWQHRRVMDAIVRCRTAALGGHRDQCSSCGHQAISYNSCRNRHCPKCQGNWEMLEKLVQEELKHGTEEARCRADRCYPATDRSRASQP